MEGFIHSIESFGTVDGPGIRYVVFFQGCPMRCKYCHNPDTWKTNAGQKMTVNQILSGYFAKQAFYRNGGITATGGEPLLQLPFLCELFEAAKRRGIHTCLDTSGITFQEKNTRLFERLIKATDYVLLDIKHVRDEEHKELTGHGNSAVWEFLDFLEKNKVPVRIRHVLLPGITLNEDALTEFGIRIRKYKTVKELELLPYHRMGASKYAELEMEYPLSGVKEPSKQEIEKAEEIVKHAILSGRSSNT